MRNGINNKHQQDTTSVSSSADTIPNIHQQDSSSMLLQDTVKKQDTISGAKKFSLDEAMKIFEEGQKRQEKIDSILQSPSAKKSETEKNIQIIKQPPFKPDSSGIIITSGDYQNPLYRSFENMWQHSYQTVSPGNNLFIKPENVSENRSNKLKAEIHVKDDKSNNLRKEIPAFWSDWILGLIILSCILLGWMKIFYNKILSQIVKSTYNYTPSHNLYINKNILTKRAFMVMNAVFFINTGLFIYLAAKNFKLNPINVQGIKMFFFFTGFILAVFLLRYIISKITGYVTMAQKLMSEQLYNIFIYAKVTGLLLLPFLIIIPYTNNYVTNIAIFAGAGLIVLMYILGIIRGIKIFTLEKVSLLYLFLYLCTFEFVPILVFLKYLEIF